MATHFHQHHPNESHGLLHTRANRGTKKVFRHSKRPADLDPFIFDEFYFPALCCAQVTNKVLNELNSTQPKAA